MDRLREITNTIHNNTDANAGSAAGKRGPGSIEAPKDAAKAGDAFSAIASAWLPTSSPGLSASQHILSHYAARHRVLGGLFGPLKGLIGGLELFNKGLRGFL